MSVGGSGGRRAGCGPLQVLAAAPPPRAAAAVGRAAASFLQALERVRGSGQPFLAVSAYQPAGCMDLVLDFEAAAAAGPPGVAGAAGSEQRARWLARVLHAISEQHGDWLAGVARAPSRRQLDSVCRMHWVVHETAAARARLVAAAQLQSIAVQVDGEEWAIPAAAALGGLLPNQHMLLLSGLDARCCRQGVAQALLSAAGYSAEQGVSVVHESAGRVASLPGEVGGVTALDRVVAVVQVPLAHAALRQLPLSVSSGIGEVQIEVRNRVVPKGLLVVRRAAPPPPPPPARVQAPLAGHPGVRGEMDRVYAAAGVTPEVRAAGSALAADAVRQSAVPPGVRSGVGFVPAGRAAAAAAPSAEAGAAAAGAAAPGVVAAAASLAPAPATAAAAGAAAAAAAGSLQPAGALVSGDADMPDCGEGGADAAEEVVHAADALMLPALPSRVPPLDEPGFGAACEHVSDSTDASPEQVQRIVMQARMVDPAAYQAARDAARPSELPRPFLLALYAQARVELGDEDAVGLEVSWAGGAEEDEAWRVPLGVQGSCSAPRAAAAAVVQRTAPAGSPPGPSSPPGDDRTGAAADAGERRGSARLRQPAAPPTSNSWLSMRAASLGHLPGMGAPPTSAGRGKRCGRGKQ